jgi:hypothetical protein
MERFRMPPGELSTRTSYRRCGKLRADLIGVSCRQCRGGILGPSILCGLGTALVSLHAKMQSTQAIQPERCGPIAGLAGGHGAFRVPAREFRAPRALDEQPRGGEALRIS